MIEFDVDMSYLLEYDELDKVVLNDEDGEHEPMEFVLIAATVGDKPKDNPRNYNPDGTPKIPNMHIGADPDWVDWVARLKHEEPLSLKEAVEQLMFEIICFGGDMGPNDCGGEHCPDEGMVYTNDFINGWVNKIAATVGARDYTYDEWRAINEAVGDAMEYAHEHAVMYPDKADPLWNIDEYVNRVLEVAYGTKDATVGARDTMGLWPEWEQVLFANVSDEVAQDNLNECVHELLDKAAMLGERNPDGLPIGLTVSNDGNLLNWMGVNYVRQDAATVGTEPDEPDMLKLHARMNVALLDMQEELLAYHPRDRENASSKKLIDCVIAAHQIIEDAATVGAGTCHIEVHDNLAETEKKRKAHVPCFVKEFPFNPLDNRMEAMQKKMDADAEYIAHLESVVKELEERLEERSSDEPMGE